MYEAQVLFDAMGRYMNSLKRYQQIEREDTMNAMAIGANLLVNIITGNIDEDTVDDWVDIGVKLAMEGKPLVGADGVESMEKRVV